MDAHKKGVMKQKGNMSSYKTTTGLKNFMGALDNWSEAPEQKYYRMPNECKKLDALFCPKCPRRSEVGNAKLTLQNGNFSKAKCQLCHETSSSRQWACTCGNLWKNVCGTCYGTSTEAKNELESIYPPKKWISRFQSEGKFSRRILPLKILNHHLRGFG